MKKIKKILIIIQRSNGDVFLSASLISQIQRKFKPKSIDLLVNDDTLSIAKTLPFVKKIYTFSYQYKKNNRFGQEKEIIKNIFRKYDLSISLTASDRSVLYAIFASKFSISSVESGFVKSWWKKIFLTSHYHFDNESHILINNLKSLYLLGLEPSKTLIPPKINKVDSDVIKDRLSQIGISNFLIFHPSAQYNYKIYPQHLRNQLLLLLNSLNIPIIITGSRNDIDTIIKKKLPSLNNIIDWIGETSIEELIALNELSIGYIGMDTLNMHIAASFNKRIFAIFGPTKLSTWSPWSNQLKTSATKNFPFQQYGNISIYQANLPCVACGKKGCSNSGMSVCLDNINPENIFLEVQKWVENVKL